MGTPARTAPPWPPQVATGPSRATAFSLAALVVLRCAYWLAAPPNSDEAYYWQWGLHPALSYLDHPPLHAWIQGLVHAALGQSVFALRLAALPTSVGTIWLVAREAMALAGSPRMPAVEAGAVVLASPLLLMLTSFAWQDHLLVFLMLLSVSLFTDVLSAVSAGERGSTGKLLAAGGVLGLAGLAKYSAALAGLGLLAAIASDARWRRLLRDRRLWAAGLVCLLALSPVLAWNLQHGLASFRFHTQERMSEGLHLHAVGVLHFLGPSLLFLSPVLAVAMAAGWREAGRAPGGPGERDAGAAAGARARTVKRISLAIFLTSSCAFLLLSLFTWTLYYWNVVAYLALLAPAVAWLQRHPRMLGWHLGVGVVLAALMLVHGAVIPLSALVGHARDEDSFEVYGWDRVAEAIREVRQPGWKIVTNDYRPASHLDWAFQAPVAVLFGFGSSQFDFWPDPHLSPGETAIIVTDGREPLASSLARRFRDVTALRAVAVVRLGVKLKEYQLWRADGFCGNACGEETGLP